MYGYKAVAMSCAAIRPVQFLCGSLSRIIVVFQGVYLLQKLSIASAIAVNMQLAYVGKGRDVKAG